MFALNYLPILALFAVKVAALPVDGSDSTPAVRAVGEGQTCNGKVRTVVKNSNNAVAAPAITTDSAVSSLNRNAVLVATSTAPAGDLSTLLSLHNTFRAKYGAQALTWNATLASYAATYGSKCVFAHSKGPYGENLAAGVGNGYNVTKAFNSWGGESAKYNYAAPGFSSATGHFTQVVWKATTQVGCAVVSCADGTIFKNMKQTSTYVICEYKVPGNVVTANNQYFKDNVGPLKA